MIRYSNTVSFLFYLISLDVNRFIKRFIGKGFNYQNQKTFESILLKRVEPVILRNLKERLAFFNIEDENVALKKKIVNSFEYRRLRLAKLKETLKSKEININNPKSIFEE